MIDLLRRATFHGPNPFAVEPVIVADIVVDDAGAANADSIAGQIVGLSSPWFEETADAGIPDDAERLVDLLLRWSVATLNWMQGCVEVRGYQKLGPGRFRVWLEFHDAALSQSALELAVRLANRAEQGRADRGELDSMLERIWDASLMRHPDSSDEIIMAGAKALDLPIAPAWNTLQMWQYGWGAKSEVIGSAATNRDGYASGMIIARKNRTKNALRRLGLPVPPGVLVRTEDEIEAAVAKIGFPCVVKPIDLGKGMGISANLKKIEEVRSAFRYARTESSLPVMIEAFVQGDDHRLLMAGGKLAVAVRRLPPFVTGDGKRTIRELTDELNIGRVHPDNLSLDRLPAVRLDDSALEHLHSQGMTPETVPESGRKVTLRSIANISTGGGAEDATADVHPDIRQACDMLAKTLQVNVAGFDYLTTDISKGWREVPGAFIELNLTPALIGFTLAGWPAAEAGKLVLSEGTGRIPVNVIVVPDELVETTEKRLADMPADPASGWASPNKACIGDLSLIVEAGQPWSGVQTLLAHRTLERARILVPSQHLQLHGLPVDRADRIWNCDPELRTEWRGVLERASRLPLWSGEWHDLEAEISGPGWNYPEG